MIEKCLVVYQTTRFIILTLITHDVVIYCTYDVWNFRLLQIRKKNRDIWEYEQHLYSTDPFFVNSWTIRNFDIPFDNEKGTNRDH